MGVTYVKSNSLPAVAAGTAGEVVDLGLGVDEAAQIMGVSFEVRFSSALIAATLGIAQVELSFDPEDVVPNEVDDDHFARCNLASTNIAACVGAIKASESKFIDFSGMTLITTRNLALVVAGVGYDMVGGATIYYEKYKPTQLDLVQLIAQRR